MIPKPFMIGQTQIEWELDRLCDLLTGLQIMPDVIVEIGVNDGYDLGRIISRLHAVSHRPSRVFAIDINLDTPRLQGLLAIQRVSHCDVIVGDSRDHRIVGQFQECLGQDEIDLLLIDSSKEPGQLERDIELYAGKVRSGGIVAIHDILNKGYAKTVMEPWERIKATSDYVEIRGREKVGDCYLGWGLYWIR